jgi:serine/threonine protein kinase
MDVNEKIDTFTLGGIFFFLLSDGRAPFYNERNHGDHIKVGEMPMLPKSAVSDHPAFEALSELVFRCRALRIEDRPTSLEVVRMLEDKLRKIELGSM